MTNTEARNKMIAEAAYYRAERRGFVGNQELQDWLEAEREISLIKPVGPDFDSSPPEDSNPGPESGNAVPAPLGKEESIRGEETRESADQLATAIQANKVAR